MDNPAIRLSVLEVDKPAFAGIQIHIPALVGTVHRCFPLMQHDFILIGAVYGLGAKNGLPAGGHAACRSEDIIVAIALVHLGAFHGRMVDFPVEDHFSVIQQRSAVRHHAAHLQPVFDAAAASGEGMDQVGFSVIIPERARIDPALNLLDHMKWGPRSCRIDGSSHIDAFIRGTEVNPELAVMMTDGRRPNAVAVTHTTVVAAGHTVHRMSDNGPVDQILGMKNRQSRRADEAGGCHIEIVAYAYNVRIGIIRIQNRILETSVSQIRLPHRSKGLLGCHLWSCSFHKRTPCN
ncbi:hypothetical protein D3C75_785380 [compost metagenome]